MAKKVYAIRKGVKPGIYHSWPEAQKQINGFSGAEYKGFSTMEDAENFMKVGLQTSTVKPKPAPTYNPFENRPGKNDVVAYVDGSYNPQTTAYGFGYTLEFKGETIEGYGGEVDPVISQMRQIGGETQAAIEAVTRAMELTPNVIWVHYDYMGIREWALRNWNANKEHTRKYQTDMGKLIDECNNRGIDVQFIKVKAHTGIVGNERADVLAKLGAGLA